MRKFIKAAILIPLALIILLFAIVNRQVVTFTLDPLGATNSVFSFSAPLFMYAFIFVLVGVVIGGVAAWLRQHKWRKAARQLEYEAQMLRNENDSLRQQLGTAQGRPGLQSLDYRPPAA